MPVNQHLHGTQDKAHVHWQPTRIRDWFGGVVWSLSALLFPTSSCLSPIQQVSLSMLTQSPTSTHHCPKHTPESCCVLPAVRAAPASTHPPWPPLQPQQLQWQVAGPSSPLEHRPRQCLLHHQQTAVATNWHCAGWACRHMCVWRFRVGRAGCVWV